MIPKAPKRLTKNTKVMHVIAILQKDFSDSREEAAEKEKIRQIITRDNRSAVIQFYSEKEKHKKRKIEKYLKMDIPYKKIITTPESFPKIRTAARKLNINIYKEYFCLFDECEKLTQDVDYRRKISQPIYDFFQFEQKLPYPFRFLLSTIQ